jgi:hypothetical protein
METCVLCEKIDKRNFKEEWGGWEWITKARMETIKWTINLLSCGLARSEMLGEVQMLEQNGNTKEMYSILS